MFVVIPDNWLPTAENINALPSPLRSYIHDLETICDPSGDQRTIICLRDQVKSLSIALSEARAASPVAKLP